LVEFGQACLNLPVFTPRKNANADVCAWRGIGDGIPQGVWIIDSMAIDGRNHIPGVDTCALGRASCLDRVD
jgi:hypothetical protein